MEHGVSQWGQRLLEIAFCKEAQVTSERIVCVWPELYPEITCNKQISVNYKCLNIVITHPWKPYVRKTMCLLTYFFFFFTKQNDFYFILFFQSSRKYSAQDFWHELCETQKMYLFYQSKQKLCIVSLSSCWMYLNRQT